MILTLTFVFLVQGRTCFSDLLYVSFLCSRCPLPPPSLPLLPLLPSSSSPSSCVISLTFFPLLWKIYNIKFTFYLFNVQFTGIKHIHIVVQPLPTIHLELFHFPKQKLLTVSGYARSARKKPFPALTCTLHSHLCLSWSSLYQEKFDWFPLGRKCVCVFIQNTLVAWLPFVSWVA